MEVTDELIQQYDKPLVGEGLPTTRLGELVVSENLVILHFLRHLGCMFCKHTVDQLRQLSEQMPRFPTIYFVHQSNVEVGSRFFAERWPGAPHIADPKLELFRLFKIRRMSGLGLFDFRVLWATLRLQRKGYRNELGYGDPYLLSGTFLFRNGKLIWKHRAAFAGDDPNWGVLTRKPT